MALIVFFSSVRSLFRASGCVWAVFCFIFMPEIEKNKNKTKTTLDNAQFNETEKSMQEWMFMMMENHLRNNLI